MKGQKKKIRKNETSVFVLKFKSRIIFIKMNVVD
jgi:hypothetical protein